VPSLVSALSRADADPLGPKGVGAASRLIMCELPHSLMRAAALAATSWLRGGAQPKTDRNDTLAEMIMSKPENIYNIADNHARTVQVCIDRLHELGANEQLKVLTERLQKLAVRATAADDHKGS
jgi:hypothetical protein